jgi:hypothetical protein
MRNIVYRLLEDLKGTAEGSLVDSKRVVGLDYDVSIGEPYIGANGFRTMVTIRFALSLLSLRRLHA